MKRACYSAIEKTALNISGTEDKTLRFFGKYYRFFKKTVNLFTKKYKFLVMPPKTPTVYVCRHKNLKGVVKVMKSANFDMHPFMLHVFKDFKSAFNQFYGYTFTKRYKLPKFIAVLPAFFSAFFTFILFRSAKAIPTYRKNTKAFITIKSASEFLLKGESVIVFPDVDYTSEDDGVLDIYSGFLTVEKIYHKKCGKHLPFVPLTIDEKSLTVKEFSPLYFNYCKPFEEERLRITNAIITNIS